LKRFILFCTLLTIAAPARAADHRLTVAPRVGAFHYGESTVGGDAAVTATWSLHPLLGVFASGSDLFSWNDAPRYLGNLAFNLKMEKGDGPAPSIFVGGGYLWVRDGLEAPEMHATASWLLRDRVSLYASALLAARDGDDLKLFRAGLAWRGVQAF
jgi:hypothetical protein